MDTRFTTNMDSKFRRENSCIKLFSQRVFYVNEWEDYSGPEYICDPNSSDPTKPVLGLFKILPKGLAPEDFMGLIVTKEITALDDSPIVVGQNSYTHCRFVQAVATVYDDVKKESALLLTLSDLDAANPIISQHNKTLYYPSFYYPNSGYFGNQLLSGEVVVRTDAVDIVSNTWVNAGISAFTPQEISDIANAAIRTRLRLYDDGMPISDANVIYKKGETEATFSVGDDELQIKVAADKSVTILASDSGWDGQHTFYIQVESIR